MQENEVFMKNEPMQGKEIIADLLSIPDLTPAERKQLVGMENKVVFSVSDRVLLTKLGVKDLSIFPTLDPGKERVQISPQPESGGDIMNR